MGHGQELSLPTIEGMILRYRKEVLEMELTEKGKQVVRSWPSSKMRVDLARGLEIGKSNKLMTPFILDENNFEQWKVSEGVQRNGSVSTK